MLEIAEKLKCAERSELAFYFLIEPGRKGQVNVFGKEVSACVILYLSLKKYIF